MTVKKYDTKGLSMLTEQAKNGNKDAQETLYRVLMPAMRRHALKRMNKNNRNPLIADEIAEDVVTTCLFEKLNELHNNDYLIAWVTACLDAACRTQNQMHNNPAIEESYVPGTADRFAYGNVWKKDTEEEDRIDLMKRCLEYIRPEYADILKMHYLNHLSYDDIVAKTGMKKSTLVGRIQTARKELKYEMIARAE